jgi:hypothetical protein
MITWIVFFQTRAFSNVTVGLPNIFFKFNFVQRMLEEFLQYYGLKWCIGADIIRNHPSG